jgi:hypothetical protein
LPPRKDRRQFLIDSVEVKYLENVDEWSPTAKEVRGKEGTTGPRTAGAVPPKTGAPKRADKRGAGFVVLVSGRLLCGERERDVQDYLDEEYFKKLREVANQPGRGFYIPDDDPQDKSKPAIGLTVPFRRLSAVRGPGAAGAADASLKDPITGEDMSNDCRVEYGFKVKLGEKSKPSDEKEKKQDSKPKKGKP